MLLKLHVSQFLQMLNLGYIWINFCERYKKLQGGDSVYDRKVLIERFSTKDICHRIYYLYVFNSYLITDVIKLDFQYAILN